MSALFSDTTPEAEQVLLDLARKTPAWRKVEMMAQINMAVREFAMLGLKQRYPDDSPQKLRRRLADLLLGRELAGKVYGPLVESEAKDDI